MKRFYDYEDEQDEEVEAISTIPQLKKHLKSYYVIHDYTDSIENYKEFVEKMYDLIKGCYEYRSLRKYPIKFKFYDSDKKFNILELRHFVVNLFFWYPLVNLHKIKGAMSDDLIIDCRKDIPNISEKVNRMIETLQEYNVKPVTINYSISEELHNLRRISGDFSIILGLNFDAYTIIDLYEKYPEIREVMESRVDDGLQPAEIERIQHADQDKLIETLIGLDDNAISVILQSGTGIKHKQLSEFLNMEGLKPDLTGKTIPIPIKNSTMIGGLKSGSDLYTDAIGSVFVSRCKTPLTAGNSH